MGTSIFEGIVLLDRDTGKVYLVTNNFVTDLNGFLGELIGEKVRVEITREEKVVCTS